MYLAKSKRLTAVSCCKFCIYRVAVNIQNLQHNNYAVNFVFIQTLHDSCMMNRARPAYKRAGNWSNKSRIKYFKSILTSLGRRALYLNMDGNIRNGELHV